MSSTQEQEAFVSRGSCKDYPGPGVHLCLYTQVLLLAHLQFLHTQLLPAPERNWSNCTIRSLAGLCSLADQGFLHKHAKGSTPCQQCSSRHGRLFVWQTIAVRGQDTHSGTSIRVNVPSRRAHTNHPLPRVWPMLCSSSLLVRFEVTAVILGHAPLPSRVTLQSSSTLGGTESHSVVQWSQGRKTPGAWSAQGFLTCGRGACTTCLVCCCPQGCLSQVFSLLLFPPTPSSNMLT